MNEAIVVLVRGIIGFFTLLIFARILGKQQISQLTFFDYVLGITIGSTASSLTTDLSSKAWPHWVGLMTWMAAGFFMQIITLKWKYAAKYMEGEPSIVIMNGKIMENELRKMRFRISNLLELLRNQGVFDVSEVEYGILESDGKLSILKKPENNPITPKDLNIQSFKKGIGVEVIYDGKLIKQNLKTVNKSEDWLKTQLNKQGIHNFSEVFLATIDEQCKNLYVDTYKDTLDKIIDVGDYKGPY
ncbi:YetF domain-containing protein [Clostridium niameyense]|uniref:YetF domain-containing protein n=1 Tax=Clostridium niameyense TaxID=1622073 RepID=UPI00067E7BFC|nr:DUF421 domain-containing protein [Clostridium niameyense]